MYSLYGYFQIDQNGCCFLKNCVSRWYSIVPYSSIFMRQTCKIEVYPIIYIIYLKWMVFLYNIPYNNNQYSSNYQQNSNSRYRPTYCCCLGIFSTLFFNWNKHGGCKSLWDRKHLTEPHEEHGLSSWGLSEKNCTIYIYIYIQIRWNFLCSILNIP